MSRFQSRPIHPLFLHSLTALLLEELALRIPPAGTSDFEIVEFRGEADLARVLAGRVVMKLRGM